MLRKTVVILMSALVIYPHVCPVSVLAQSNNTLFNSTSSDVNIETGYMTFSPDAYVEFSSPDKIYALNGVTYLDPGDKCIITDIQGMGDEEQICVAYETSRGSGQYSMPKWYDRNAIFPGKQLNKAFYKLEATDYIQAYADENLSTKFGRVFPGDVIFAMYNGNKAKSLAMPMDGTILERSNI